MERAAHRCDARAGRQDRERRLTCSKLDLPERQRLLDVPYVGGRILARARSRAAEPRFHVREHGAHGESATHARHDHDVHDAARGSVASVQNGGSPRYIGAARGPRARVSTYELRELPSNRWADAELD